MNRKLISLYENVAAKHLESDCYVWNVRESDLNSMIQEVVESIEPDSDGIFQASSPWEAAIFLVDLQVRNGLVDTHTPIPTGETIQRPNFKSIFRGQKAQYKNIEPSAWRAQTWERAGLAQELGENWLAAFCLLLKLITEQETNMSLQAHLYSGAAQHYQIPTDLLDWTVDPFISIWFAHSGTINKGDRGRVYCIELENNQRSSILLPPPFIKRLYRQRGLFHYTTQPNRQANHDLFEKSMKIEFPLASSWKLPLSFPYSRTNQLIIQDWFLIDVRDSAKKIASSVRPDYFEFINSRNEQEIKSKMEETKATVLKNDLERLATQYRDRFTRRKWENLLREWIVETNNYLNWLCTLESESGQSLVVFDSIDSMTELNRDALLLYAQWILENAPQQVREQRATLANRIRGRLQ